MKSSIQGRTLTQDEVSLLLSHSNMSEPAESFMFRGQKVSVEAVDQESGQQAWEWTLKVHQDDPPDES
jgi:hypothetical protein